MSADKRAARPKKQPADAPRQRERIEQWLDERKAAPDGRPMADADMQFAEQAWRNRRQFA